MLEFDVHFTATAAPFRVYHIAGYDTGSHCSTLEECLQSVKGWSDTHPSHFPIFVMLQQRGVLMNESDWDIFDQKLESVFPRARIVTPDDIRGGSTTLREHIVTQGWPDVDTLKGKVLFCLLNQEDRPAAYHIGTHVGLAGRNAFLLMGINETDQAEASLIELENTLDYMEEVESLVSQNFIIRARADGSYRPYNRTAEELEAEIFVVVDTNANSYVTVAETGSFLSALGFPVAPASLSFLLGSCGAGVFGANFTQFQCSLSIAATQGLNLAATFGLEAMEEVELRRDATLDSGVHFIGTDYASPPFEGADPEDYYWVSIPGGEPLRCNPITTEGVSCNTADFESPVETSSQSTEEESSATRPLMTSLSVMLAVLLAFKY